MAWIISGIIIELLKGEYKIDIVWGNCGETLLNKSQKIQNIAARIIMTGSDYDAPSEPLLLELGWRNIRELITDDTVVMMQKSKYNLVPEYIKSSPAK